MLVSSSKVKYTDGVGAIVSEIDGYAVSEPFNEEQQNAWDYLERAWDTDYVSETPDIEFVHFLPNHTRLYVTYERA